MRAQFLLFLCFAGCATMNTMVTNMETMNDTIQENIVTMQNSGTKIEANTAEVVRSTNQMQDFKNIISSNTHTIHQGVDNAKEHSSRLPIFFIALFALLFLPTAICLLFYYKFFQHMQKRKR